MGSAFRNHILAIEGPAPFILWDAVLREVGSLTTHIQLSTEASQLCDNQRCNVLRAELAKAKCSCPRAVLQ